MDVDGDNRTSTQKANNEGFEDGRILEKSPEDTFIILIDE
jgi:hypothetical protein